MGKRKKVHNRYIHKRRRTWYVRVAVPPSLVPEVGKSHILRSLKTRDVKVARERRWAALAEIKRELAEIGSTTGDPIELALKERPWWLSASNDPADRDPEIHMTPRQEVEVVISDKAEEIQEKYGYEAAKQYYQIATSSDPVLSDVSQRWLKELEDQVSQQTIRQHGYAVKLFREANPNIVTVTKINRAVAGRFVSENLHGSGKSRRTVNRIISSLSALWKWMIKRGLVETNPWVGQGDYGRKVKGTSERKRPFSSDELRKLLKGDPDELMGRRYGPVIADLLRLGLLTGARLNEICELRTEDVVPTDRAIRIQGGKTRAAQRTIPVHEAVWPIIVRRQETAKDGQLFPELEPQGPDLKRSWYVSKRITQYRRKILGQDDTVDFHSLRRCFATYLELAQAITLDVNPSVIAELMGHTKSTLALSVYSGGIRLEGLRKAITALDRTIEPQVLDAI